MKIQENPNGFLSLAVLLTAFGYLFANEGDGSLWDGPRRFKLPVKFVGVSPFEDSPAVRLKFFTDLSRVRTVTANKEVKVEPKDAVSSRKNQNLFYKQLSSPDLEFLHDTYAPRIPLVNKYLPLGFLNNLMLRYFQRKMLVGREVAESSTTTDVSIAAVHENNENEIKDSYKINDGASNEKKSEPSVTNYMTQVRNVDEVDEGTPTLTDESLTEDKDTPTKLFHMRVTPKVYTSALKQNLDDSFHVEQKEEDLQPEVRVKKGFVKRSPQTLSLSYLEETDDEPKILPYERESLDLNPDFSFDKDRISEPNPSGEVSEETPVKEIVIRPAVRTIEKSVAIGDESDFEMGYESSAIVQSEISQSYGGAKDPEIPREDLAEVQETDVGGSDDSKEFSDDTFHIEVNKDETDFKFDELPTASDELKKSLLKVLTILPPQYLKRSLAFDEVCKKILNIRSLKDAIGLVGDMFKTSKSLDAEAKDHSSEEEEEDGEEEAIAELLVRPQRKFETEVFPPVANDDSKREGEIATEEEAEKTEGVNLDAETKEDSDSSLLENTKMQPEDTEYEGEKPRKIVIIRPGWRQYSENFPSKPSLKHSFSEMWEKPTKIVITRTGRQQYKEHFPLPARYSQNKDGADQLGEVVKHTDGPVIQEYHESYPVGNVNANVKYDEDHDEDEEPMEAVDGKIGEYEGSQELKSSNDKGKYFAPPLVQKESSKIKDLIHPLLKMYIGRMLV